MRLPNLWNGRICFAFKWNSNSNLFSEVVLRKCQTNIGCRARIIKILERKIPSHVPLAAIAERINYSVKIEVQTDCQRRWTKSKWINSNFFFPTSEISWSYHYVINSDIEQFITWCIWHFGRFFPNTIRVTKAHSFRKGRKDLHWGRHNNNKPKKDVFYSELICYLPLVLKLNGRNTVVPHK